MNSIYKMMAIAAGMMTLVLPDSAAAYYSPALGRFVQRDPSGYVDGMNPYQSLMSNPNGLLDPLGTQVLDPTGDQKYCLGSGRVIITSRSSFGNIPLWCDAVCSQVPAQAKKWFQKHLPRCKSLPDNGCPRNRVAGISRTRGQRDIDGINVDAMLAVALTYLQVDSKETTMPFANLTTVRNGRLLIAGCHCQIRLFAPEKDVAIYKRS